MGIAIPDLECTGGNMIDTATSPSSSTSTGTPPIAFMIAVLVGMSHDQIDLGLREGWIADSAHHAHVVSLAGKDGAEIASLARTDIGVRYALMNLDAVALTGNRALFASHNADGELDRFDADTGDANMSDSWIADRAKFLAWKMHSDDSG